MSEGEPMRVVPRGRARRTPAQSGGPRHVEFAKRRARLATVDRRQHLGNRRDSGDGLTREGAQGVRDGADEPAVHVHRTAAHALHHPRGGQGTTFEFCEDQIPPWRHHVLEHADDVRAEFLELGPRIHRSADADHAGPDVGHRHERGLRTGRSQGQYRQGREHKGANQAA